MLSIPLPTITQSAEWKPRGSIRSEAEAKGEVVVVVGGGRCGVPHVEAEPEAERLAEGLRLDNDAVRGRTDTRGQSTS